MVEIIRPLTVDTSAVTQGASTDANRTSITFQNTHATAEVYLSSNPNVTTTTGIRIPPGAVITFAREYGDDPTLNYYLISDTISTPVIALDGYGNIPTLTKR